MWHEFPRADNDAAAASPAATGSADIGGFVRAGGRRKCSERRRCGGWRPGIQQHDCDLAAGCA